MGKLHFITYAEGKGRDGYEFSNTQKLMIDSIQSKTNKEVVFHTHNLESISKKEWFKYIKDLPLINRPSYIRRDGYYCAYKIFLTKEVYDLMDDDDILYYNDSSQYFRIGFTENIDRLLKYVEYNGHVCGSVGNTRKNSSPGCCDNPYIWKMIWPDSIEIFENILNKPHILAAWYLFTKNKKSEDFINEWINSATNLKLNDLPIITYHHTVDQSLLNIIAYKHGYKTFKNNVTHEENKNHNEIHQKLNQELNDDIETLSKWFVEANKLEDILPGR